MTGWTTRASSDRATLDGWALEFPGCNWGVLTGNGLGVLDIDTKSDPFGFGGFDSLIRVEEETGADLTRLPLVETYSGAHLYFRYTGDLPSRVPWVPYLDVKADGGHQVAAPGTVRDGEFGGRTYTVLRGSLDEIPYAPETLLAAIRTWRVGVAGGFGGGGSSVDLPETAWLREHGFRLGQRDNGFNTLAWKLTRTHYPHMDLVHQIAYEVWLHTDNPPNDPLPWSKVQSQIARAERSIGPDEQRMRSWAQSLRSGND